MSVLYVHMYARLSNSITSRIVHLFLYVFQQTLTADNVEEVADRVSNIVQTTEDQSSENLQAVTDVLSNTVNLLGNISVSREVIMLIVFALIILYRNVLYTLPQHFYDSMRFPE